MIRFRDVTPSIENASGFFNFRQIEKAIKNDQWPSLQVNEIFEGLPTGTPLSVENFFSASYDITTKNASFTLQLTKVHYTSSTLLYPVMIGSTTSSFGFGQNSIIKLIVNSDIIGAGGSAGAAGTTNAASGNNGGNGGPALYADYTLDANQTIIIENNANILGGGGGGGGGGAGENSALQYVEDSAQEYNFDGTNYTTAGTYVFQNKTFSGTSPFQNSLAYWDGVQQGSNTQSSSITSFFNNGKWYRRGALQVDNGLFDYYAISTREYIIGTTTFGIGGTGGAGGGWNSTGNNGGTGANGTIPPNSTSSVLCAGGNGGAGGAPGENGEDGGTGRKALYVFQGTQPTGGPTYSFTSAIDTNGNGGTGGTAGIAITGIDKITLINNGTVGTTI